MTKPQIQILRTLSRGQRIDAADLKAGIRSVGALVRRGLVRHESWRRVLPDTRCTVKMTTYQITPEGKYVLEQLS